MNVENVKDIINFAEINKYEVKVRDIAYVVLENTFESRDLAYKTIFHENTTKTSKEIKDYDKSEKIQCIKGYIFSNKLLLTSKEIDEISHQNQLSADENKEGMIKLLHIIEKAMDEGKITKRDGITKMVDIRTKLQTRFDMEGTDKNTHVIVMNKYNAICPYCNHEISINKNEDE